MRKAKSIDEIYEEVKDCELVITNDAPLATALNSRVDKATIGNFAYTPRQIAGKESVRILGKGILGDLRIISSIADETGLDFKYIHGELENIRTIRRYRANPENYLYSQSAKEVYRSFAALPTIEKVMSNYDPSDSLFYRGKKIAVIGLDLFDDLDKHFIPNDFKEIDLYKGGVYDIEKIHQIGNDRQIADNIMDLITPEMADDTAIVMDTEGPVADAIRAALYRKKLPFKNTMAVRDLSQIRDFLQFVTLALNYDTVRVRHVREILSSYGGYLRSTQDEYLLCKQINNIENEKTVMLVNIMKDVRSMTFGEVMESVVNPMQRPQVKILLEDLMLVDRKVTTKLVNELTYAVNNVADLHHNEQTPENEKRGVLLVNCNNSVYIDRPFVIFVGIGPEWSPSIIGKDYIDRDEESEKNIERFSVLMQQGTSRVYAVNLMRGGKPARPCTYFDQIYYGKRIETFDDVCSSGETIKGPWVVSVEKEISVKGDTHVERQPVYSWSFSKSTYDAFRECPRVYLFSKIMRAPDSEFTVFGNVIHEFAELYLCDPDLVNEKGIEHFLEKLEESYAGISCEQMVPIDRTQLSASMMNVKRYIDGLKIKDVPLDMINADRPHPNKLMESEGVERCSSIAEKQLHSSKFPLFGDMDLIDGQNITDYKTGGFKKLGDLKKMMISDVEHPEFQPLIYLALAYDNSGKLPCTFSQFYVRSDVASSVSDPDYDVLSGVRSIELVGSTLEEYLHDPGCCLKDHFGGNDYPRYLESWDSFINAISGHGLERGSDLDTDPETMASVFSVIGQKKVITTAIRKITANILGGIVVGKDRLVIPIDTIRKFISRVEEDHRAASEMAVGTFPPKPMLNCSKCNYRQACTRELSKVEESEESE